MNPFRQQIREMIQFDIYVFQNFYYTIHTFMKISKVGFLQNDFMKNFIVKIWNCKM